jgi:hypothetical protein
MIALMGIIVHFLDADNILRTFLLALPEQLDSHRGINIAETVKDILVEYGLENKLGYFVADNADNNDTCLEELAVEYGFNKEHRRLRCMGHVINLVARMLLFGVDPDGFEEENQTPKELRKELELWRKLGPVGKLHNIVVWIMRSPQRRQKFYKHQKVELISLDDKASKNQRTYDLIEANDTRWNSTKNEIERGIKLRNPIDAMIGAEVLAWKQYWNKITNNGTKDPPKNHRSEPPIVQDYLTDDDWHVLTVYLDILKPLEEATKRLEGRPTKGQFGAIWEVLPTMEWLLDQFESFKIQYEHHPESHFRHNVVQAWMKLDKYFKLTDLSPAYVAAVVFHPRLKWSFVEKYWDGIERQQWREDAKQAVEALWEEYKIRPLPAEVSPRPDSQISITSSLNDYLTSVIGYSSSTSATDDLDEYKQYIARMDNEEDRVVDNPIQYWVEKRKRWPRLAQMALDLLSIPAMSAEPERIFSLAGLMVVANRGRLLSDIIGASMCLSSWERMGIISIAGDEAKG